MRGEGVLLCLAVVAGCATVEPRGTGDLGIVVERAAGTRQLVDTPRRVAIGRVPRVAISG
jgi:protein NirF